MDTTCRHLWPLMATLWNGEARKRKWQERRSVDREVPDERRLATSLLASHLAGAVLPRVNLRPRARSMRTWHNW